MKMDANDILREHGEDALRASFDEAAARAQRYRTSEPLDEGDIVVPFILNHIDTRYMVIPYIPDEYVGTNEDAKDHINGNKLSLTSGQFVEGFVPPDYLIDGLLQRRFCYSNTGQTGGGKTALALLIAAHVALGRPLGGREVEQGRVLFFAGENPDDIRMRWIAMADALAFDVQTIDVHFIPGRFSLAELAERIRQEAERLDGLSLAIVDTSAAYFPGDNENDNVQAGNHARVLRGFTDLRGGPTVLVNCHPPKGAGPDNLTPRGGGAFLAEVDGNLTCSKSDTLVTLGSQGKFRGPDFEPICFGLRSATAERLKDSKGRSIFTIYAQPLSADEQQRKAGTTRDDEDAVLIALLDDSTEHSMAGIANQCRWQTSKGEPHKSKVHRIIETLRAEKYVSKERGSPILTEKGKTEAKKVKFNRDNAGARYD